jgi:hypothetical protein
MSDDAGPLLVRAGLLTDAKLKAAYETAAKAGETLVEHLVSSGLLDEDRLCEFFRERLLVPRVGVTDLERVARRVVSFVPRDMAVMFRCVPLAADAHKNLALVMTDPAQTHAVDEVRFWTSMTIYRVVAPARAVAWALEAYYGVRTPLSPPRAPAPSPGGAKKLPPAQIIEDVYGEDTPIPSPVPFDETTGRIVLIDPRSLSETLAQYERRAATVYPESEGALHEAVRLLGAAGDRDAVCAGAVAFLQKLCRRAAFFVVRQGELVGHLGHGVGVRPVNLRSAHLSLDRNSTFRDIVHTRLPYRGPVTDIPSRDFLIDALGWAPSEMLAVPLTVRERVVGVLYGDEREHPLPDDHLTALSRAAELALERVLVAKKSAD